MLMGPFALKDGIFKTLRRLISPAGSRSLPVSARTTNFTAAMTVS